MSESLLISVENITEEKQIGVILLNLPQTLNSLTLEMIEGISEVLSKWETDKKIVAIYMDSTMEKAFCAGGDVQKLYHAAVEHLGGYCEYAERFFSKEYRLNYQIHQYPKPIVCRGNGLVVGGGVGLFAGASYRVVTERSRISMPEITIALFPDVGGSWFLNKIDNNLGLFYGLTTASLNARDALYVGMANYSVHSECNLLDEIVTYCSAYPSESFDESVANVLANNSLADLPESDLHEFERNIIEICSQPSLEGFGRGLGEIKGDSPWLDKAKIAFAHGSPLSAQIIYKQLAKSKNYSLEEVFKSELMLAINIVRYPEFSEGVRALLIEKDRNPQWMHKSITAVPEDLVESFFLPPWKSNPLDDL